MLKMCLQQVYKSFLREIFSLTHSVWRYIRGMEKNGKSHPLSFSFQSHTQKKCFLLTFSHSSDKNTFIYLSLSLTTLHLLLLKSFFRVRTQEKKSFFLSRFVSFSQHRFNDFHSISIAIAMQVGYICVYGWMDGYIQVDFVSKATGEQISRTFVFRVQKNTLKFLQWIYLEIRMW